MSLKPRTGPTFANTVSLVALALALTSPAWGSPVAGAAGGLAQTAGSALGLSKKANKKATRALRTAKKALAKGGPAGSPGQAGSPGAPGPPGPTASSFASHDPEDFVVGNVSQGVTQVIDLNDHTFGSNAGPIVVPFPGRVQVEAALFFFGGGGGGRIDCLPKIAPVGGAYAEMDAQIMAVDIPNGTVDTLPVLGSEDVPAGTYNVKVDCGTTFGNNVTFVSGTLLASAVAK